jgi:hypothetical protein
VLVVVVVVEVLDVLLEAVVVELEVEDLVVVELEVDVVELEEDAVVLVDDEDEDSLEIEELLLVVLDALTWYTSPP